MVARLQKLYGQAYDRAGAMAGSRRGVAARILDKYPKAAYTHCLSHVRNLCIVRSTNISDISNVMEKAGKVAQFFNSPKRHIALDKFINELHQSDTESSK